MTASAGVTIGGRAGESNFRYEAEVRLPPYYLRSNKRKFVLELCADISAEALKPISVQDVVLKQGDVKYRSEYPHLMRLELQQAAQIMARAPYLIEEGSWRRSKAYLFDERYRAYVVPGTLWRRPT